MFDKHRSFLDRMALFLVLTGNVSAQSSCESGRLAT